MRNPDRTYITLYDRSVYILNEQMDVVNHWFKIFQTTKDPDLRKRNSKRVAQELAVFSGMQELFNATFRDYTIKTEIIETPAGERYNFWIEAR